MMKRWSLALAVSLLAASGTVLPAQAQDSPPRSASSRAEEAAELWNMIGNKLVAMAQDFPEDKYDFKVQKDQRTFALNLLHAAALDYVVIRKVAGDKTIGPDFGDGDNPTRDQFKTKADIVRFVQSAISDGANVIRQQGDAGLDKTSSWGKRMVHNSYLWTFTTEHSAEHYGQLVVYYRANGLVPPDSRR